MYSDFPYVFIIQGEIMKVIVSHQNIDFDGLASMVACSKLYPDATMFFAGKLGEEVKKFYSLYKNVLHISTGSQMDLTEVEALYVVDVNVPQRIGKFKDLVDKNIPIVIYDHHSTSEKTIASAEKIMKPYGACATILVEEIIKRNIPISPFEATVIALGIYTDTGSLIFNSTTYQDVEAVAFLLKQGANLAVIKEFLNTSLDEQQDQLFSSLLNSLEILEINGFQVAVSTLTKEDFIGELGIMAEKLMNIKRCDAVFLIVKMIDRCYIVGRSGIDEVNIPYILEIFNGAGHKKAASATVKNGEPKVLKEQLVEMLFKRVQKQITAREIMSYPVKTVYDDMTVEEVNKIMLRYGHTGMPVIKGEHIIGIISRTDIDKAIVHGLTHAPVKGFMTSNVMSIDDDTPITDINHLFVKHNIGRVPVVVEGRIVGIVTRTDLLKVIHGNNYPNWYKKTYDEIDPIEGVNLRDQMLKLPADILNILKLAGKIGDELNKKVYVVGGFVRDLILGAKNWDIDLVIEGDGLQYAEGLNKELKGETKLYHQFGTALITLDSGKTIDIVTARREYYEYPAALPKIEQSTIWSDLFRRDFTINCMALQLNQEDFGVLIDYFGGLRDLKEKQIRVLYNLSFIEDPTRIFRAIRFASRFGFEIEVESKNFMLQAVNTQMIQKLSDDRIREEILQIMKEKSICDSLLMLQETKVFNSLHPELKIDKGILDKICRIEGTISEFKELYSGEINQLLIIIMQLLSEFPLKELEVIIKRFTLNKNVEKQIQKALEDRDEIYKLLSQENLDSYQLYRVLQNISIETLVFYHNDCNHSFIRHYILYYLLKLKHITTLISGKELKEWGIKPGPIYSKVLDEVLSAKVKGYIYSHQEEIDYAQKLLKELKGE